MSFCRRFDWRGVAVLAFLLVCISLAAAYRLAVVRKASLAADDDIFEGPNQTMISLAGKNLTVTLDDAQAMRAALLAYLATSSASDRDDLVRMVRETPGWIDADGILRIGPWLLEARANSLVLSNRLPHGPTGGGNYVAYLEQVPNGWTISKLELERVKYRP